MRLDVALVERGLARSRTQAQSLIAAGAVVVNGVPVTRSAERVSGRDDIVAAPEPYVSRAADKLIGALDDLELDVAGKRALDAGASTGGFTQVLLERGCPEVVAVDVGHGQLDARLRGEPRVRVWEHTNLRALTLEHVDGCPVDLVVADVSFISLTLLIAPLIGVLRADGDLLVLVKPQFEVGRQQLGRDGVVREPDLRRRAVSEVLETAAARQWYGHQVVASRRPGATGNREYFALLRSVPPGHPLDLPTELT